MTALIYFTVLAFELYAEVQMQLHDSGVLLFISKPMLMLILMFWVFRQVALNLSHRNLLLFALFFSWLGDVFLMFLPWYEISFLFGLAAFLIAHCLYIVLFVKQSGGVKSLSFSKVLPLGLYGVGLIALLFHWQTPAFAEMKYAVIIYASVILLMLLSSMMRKEAVPGSSFQLVFAGALLFVVSDSIIALNQFSPLFTEHRVTARFLIMTLYALAQFLIVKGVLLSAVKQNQQPSHAS